jgi:RNA polymerase sigma factor (TIGR02999 family)
MADQGDITALLQKWRAGDSNALDLLTPIVYQTLKQQARSLMSRERAGHTLTPTALVHEAYFRLAGQDRTDWQNRNHFLAIASTIMRRVLVDHAKSVQALKRSPDLHDPNVLASWEGALDPPPERLLDLHDALDELARLDVRKSRVVELKYFGGMTIDEIASTLETAAATVERDWAFSKAWLHQRMSGGNLNASDPIGGIESSGSSQPAARRS